jgi:hypothetical protein
MPKVEPKKTRSRKQEDEMSDDMPNLVEQIVCLANSRKIAGRCIVGKRTGGDRSWFRPISDRSGHEISEIDRRYPDGKTAQLLDVIEIPCIKAMPHGHQSENVLIDDRFYWEKKGRAPWMDILALVDQGADLWANEFNAYYNQNNRVPDGLIDEGGGSLRLIELDEIVLHAGPKAPDFGNMKPIVRASFEYQGQEYKLDLTDPEYERACLEKGAGVYCLKSVIACVSLSELYTSQNGETFAYKLVASIITPERAGV